MEGIDPIRTRACAFGLAALLFAACSSREPSMAPAPVMGPPEHHCDCTTWQPQTSTPDGTREPGWPPPYLHDPFSPMPPPSKAGGTVPE